MDSIPSSSNSSVQSQMNSTSSDSNQSEGSQDSTNRSSSSGDMEQQDDGSNRHTQSNDHEQQGNIILSGQNAVTVLTKLLSVFPRYREGPLPATTLQSLPRVLVMVVKDCTKPGTTLWAAKAIAYLCYALPESAGLLVSYGAVPALCRRLHAIDNQEVAEQCIRALGKISIHQPVACLQGGATMAILNSIGFFSTSIQRAAIITLERIYYVSYQTLHSESPIPSVWMEAVPILRNLLQCENPQLAECAISCLIMTVKQVAVKSPEMLVELCEHGLIEQVTCLLSLTRQKNLSPYMYTSCIILLGNISSGSVVAFRTLHDLDIGSILKDILSLLDLSNGMSCLPLVGKYFNPGYEVLKLLNELLPAVTKNQSDPQMLDKESFLADRPYLLQKLEVDVLPQLVKVVNSDQDARVCHGCLSIIYKIVYFSKSDMLVESLENTSISSFLTGVFTRWDYHVLILGLQIAELILQKFSDNFLKLFIKEGVSFAIKALSSPETSLRLNFNQNFNSRVKCLCYTFSYGQSPASSNIRHCKLDKDSMYNLSKHIEAKYLEPGHVFKKGSTDDIPQNLRYLSSELNRLLRISVDNDSTGSLIEDEINGILYEMLEMLSGKEQVSVFEFIESGIVQSLANFVFLGEHVRKNGGLVKGVGGYDAVIEKRVEALAKVSLSVSKHLSGDTPLCLLIRYLQNALITILEAFFVIPSGAHGPPTKSKGIFPPVGISDMDKSSAANAILFLLKRIHAFCCTKTSNPKSLVPSVAQNEFVNKKLTEKLEQKMQVRGVPVWFYQLMDSYSFLISFETRCKLFKLEAYDQPPTQHTDSETLSHSEWPSKNFVVFRNLILFSAAQIMNQHAGEKVAFEVEEFYGEIGMGIGLTLEFYTLVCKEFQKPGLGMWREDTCSFTLKTDLQDKETRVHSQYGLFPRPWLSMQDTSIDMLFSKVKKKFVLLGQVVAKAIEDGWRLDFHFSKAFYKLILGKKLSLYDIQSFDPGLGSVLLEFCELVKRKKHLESDCRGDSVLENDLTFRGTRIEDLCLEFSIPGYPQICLPSGPNREMVNMSNLEDYVSLVTDVTVGSGISGQVEAFKSGFNQVLPIKHLRIFSEEELELILCGEQGSWTFNELAEHIEFDYGYDARSPPIVNLLEILQEFDHEQRRAFLQFVTGSPRLPPGGLASLCPKLTVIEMLFSCAGAETDLPCASTCTNLLQLPSYSSKETMKEKLLYAITEGQGSFQLP